MQLEYVFCPHLEYFFGQILNSIQYLYLGIISRTMRYFHSTFENLIDFYVVLHLHALLCFSCFLTCSIIQHIISANRVLVFYYLHHVFQTTKLLSADGISNSTNNVNCSKCRNAINNHILKKSEEISCPLKKK